MKGLKKTIGRLIFAAVMSITVLSADAVPMTVKAEEAAEEKESSLKELYADAFYIGVAAPDYVVTTEPYKSLVKQQFNSMTMENEMKPDYIMDKAESMAHPDIYKEHVAVNFNACKNGLDFAKENGISVRGHVLVWHSQTPDWFFYENYDTSGQLADRDLMLKRMENYIKDVICYTETNYPGVIYAWDVVNEAVADPWGLDLKAGEASPMRQEGSLWYQTIGEDFVQNAFAYARKYTKEYAPDRKIKLFYNDYNEYFEQKTDGIIQLLTPVKEAGNLDGIGMQSHISVGWELYGINGYMTALEKFSKELGVEIQVTELDIGMAEGDTEEIQGSYYQKFMEALLAEKYQGADITSVTFWGLSDELSWRKEENCLLFRKDLSKKPAFDGLVIAAEKVVPAEKPDEDKKDPEGEEEKPADNKKDPADDEKTPSEDTRLPADNGQTPSDSTTNSTNPDASTQPAGDAQIDTLVEGKVYTAGSYTYRITSLAGKTAAVTGTTKQTKTITVKDTVKIENVSFKITAVEKNAFYGNKKVTTVKIGKNVKTIGARAFSKCANLQKVTINSKTLSTIETKAFYNSKKLKNVKIISLKLKTVGKNAFKGIAKKAKIDVPDKKVGTYKKLLKKGNLAKSAVIR